MKKIESQGVGGAVAEGAEGVGVVSEVRLKVLGSGIGSIMGGAAMPALYHLGVCVWFSLRGGLFMMSDAGKNVMSKIPGPK